VISNFVKQRKRDGKRPTLEVKGGHLALEGGVDTDLSVWEDKQWIEQVIGTLPPAQRDVMRCVMDGLTTAEICDRLGKTDACVRKNLQLARNRLKSHLRQDYEVKQKTAPTSLTPKPRKEEVL
jgi:DNA-directed RNA polymerase specialized sigma24 family protein